MPDIYVDNYNKTQQTRQPAFWEHEAFGNRSSHIAPPRLIPVPRPKDGSGFRLFGWLRKG